MYASFNMLEVTEMTIKATIKKNKPSPVLTLGLNQAEHSKCIGCEGKLYLCLRSKVRLKNILLDLEQEVAGCSDTWALGFF